MAKVTALSDKAVEFDRTAEGIVDDMNLAEIVKEEMLVYGAMTIEDRAIPDFRDGFKKVHRRILWAMNDPTNGARASGPFTKASEINGFVMGKFHPHGDQAIHDSMTTMVNYSNSLIEGQGNWGGMNDRAGAMRYIECRLSRFAHKVVLDPYIMTCLDTAPNYTGRLQEPVVFVPNLPLALLYGSSGIAVGTTTEVPAFTLASVTSLIRAAMSRTIKNGKFTPVTAKDCAGILRFHSHYGGEMVSPPNEVIAFFNSNEGKLQWSATNEYIEKGNYVSITGFPPNWEYRSKVLGTKPNPKTGKAGKAARLEGIEGVREVAIFNNEKTGADEVRVILRKGLSNGEHRVAMEKIDKMMVCNANYVLNFTERFLQYDDDNPEAAPEIKARFFTCSIPEMINLWIKWRVKQHIKILQYDLKSLQAQLRREQLLRDAIDIIDELVAMARKRGKWADKEFDKVQELMKLLKCTEEESKWVWSIAIGRFDKLSEADQNAKIERLTDQIALIERRIAAPFRATYNFISKALEGK